MRGARSFLFRLPAGRDFHGGLLDFCRSEGVRCAWVHAIGALSGARLGFYDRRLRRYLEKSFRGDFELLSCSGNVSWKEGGVFAHLHAVLGDRKWRAFGGHLCPGSTVFVAEVRLQECPLRLERVLDPDSGLFLWPER